MNPQTDPLRELSPGIRPSVVSPTRPLYWSIRREFWENRSLYVAPLGVAALILVGSLISAVHLSQTTRAALALPPMEQYERIQGPYTVAATLLMGTTFVVAVFYCLDALYGERRDRSVLFWKSLPVSDTTTVLAKAIIPMVFLPLITFAITFLTQGITLLVESAVLAGSGLSVVTLWSHLSLFQMGGMLLYHLVLIHGLWYAPMFAYLLMVSAWARRAAFLWAFVPPLAIALVEKIAFNTTHFAMFLQHRLSGGEEGAKYITGTMSLEPLAMLNPAHFVISPGLWGGFVVAAAFLFVTARLRRHRGPI